MMFRGSKTLWQTLCKTLCTGNTGLSLLRRTLCLWHRVFYAVRDNRQNPVCEGAKGFSSPPHMPLDFRRGTWERVGYEKLRIWLRCRACASIKCLGSRVIPAPANRPITARRRGQAKGKAGAVLQRVAYIGRRPRSPLTAPHAHLARLIRSNAYRARKRRLAMKRGRKTQKPSCITSSRTARLKTTALLPQLPCATASKAG